MSRLHAMAQDLESIWVDWEAPSLAPQGYLIEWGLNSRSYNYSHKSWRIEPGGNTTGILLEGEAGLGPRDKKKKQREGCLSRGSCNLPREAASQPFLNPYMRKVLPPL